ncbi:MAG: hypothetical protein GEU83_14925 [Pseudonocardiaceae bacterium]|nr:hypothetical protein [Pseudonocardiaceae bacterium]
MPGGRPVRGARVTLLDAAGGVHASTDTDEDGHYGFTGLDAGEYTLTASGYPAVTNTVHVSRRDQHDVELAHPDGTAPTQPGGWPPD